MQQSGRNWYCYVLAIKPCVAAAASAATATCFRILCNAFAPRHASHKAAVSQHHISAIVVVVVVMVAGYCFASTRDYVTWNIYIYHVYCQLNNRKIHFHSMRHNVIL